jgi:hypothetical protein
VTGERQTEESEVAPLAAKRPEENSGQDSFFQKSFTPRQMDLFTAALWTLHDGNSPALELAYRIAAQFSIAGGQGVCLILYTST